MIYKKLLLTLFSLFIMTLITSCYRNGMAIRSIEVDFLVDNTSSIISSDIRIARENAWGYSDIVMESTIIEGVNKLTFIGTDNWPLAGYNNQTKATDFDFNILIKTIDNVIFNEIVRISIFSNAEDNKVRVHKESKNITIDNSEEMTLHFTFTYWYGAWY